MQQTNLMLMMTMDNHSNFLINWVLASKEAGTLIADGYRILLSCKMVSRGFISMYNSRKKNRISFKVSENGYMIIKNGKQVAERKNG